MVTKGTGTFEVVENGTAVVTGRLFQPENVAKEVLELTYPTFKDTPLTPPPLTPNDVYKELRLRGYNYSGIFKGIKHMHSSGVIGTLEWCENWVSFMDTLLQVEILQLDSRSLYVPTAIEKLTIDPKRHINVLNEITATEEKSK
jgi:fatty acid synthase, animal type